MKNKTVYTTLEQFQNAASMFGGFAFVSLSFSMGGDTVDSGDTIFFFEALAFTSYVFLHTILYCVVAGTGAVRPQVVVFSSRRASGIMQKTRRKKAFALTEHEREFL